MGVLGIAQITITDLNDIVAAVLSTYSVNIPCDAAGTVTSYAGATTTASLVQGVSTISGATLGTLSTSNCTATKSGMAVSITAVSADSGYVDIPVKDASGTVVDTKRFNFAKVKQGNTGNTGSSVAKLTLSLPDGNAFQGGIGGSKTVDVRVMYGEVDVTASTTLKWFFNGVEQTNLQNLNTLEVYPADVNGSLTVKVVGTYNSIQYQDSVLIMDLDDVYQVSISGNDKIKNSAGSAVLTANVFRGATQIFNGFRCRWTNIGTSPSTVIYEGINTTGTLQERGVVITLTPSQINEKLDLLCEVSVDTVEQQLDTTEAQFIPSYDSRAYATAMSVALA